MNYKAHQQGLSIIELMVAVALSSLLLFGVLNIFDGTKRSTQIANSFSRVQEGGRIATEMMARDIRMADYWGCTPDSSKIFDHLDSSDSDYSAELNPASQEGINGADNVGNGVTVGGIPVKAGTDTLTLRGASRHPNLKIVSPYMTPNSATIHVSTGTDVPKGMVLLISDCNAADLFSNTQNNTRTSGQINHATGTVNSGPDNAIKDMSQTYGADAQILIPTVRTYFIGQPPGTTIWSLWRRVDGQNQELVRDVEDLQIVYGEDSSGDGSVDGFDVASGVDMEDVISVRVALDVRNTSSTTSDPMSRNFTVTANVRNRSL